MPPEPPSFYAKRNCCYGASSPSPRELGDRHEIGVERILWGSDYPHYEGTYPNTRQAMRHTLPRHARGRGARDARRERRAALRLRPGEAPGLGRPARAEALRDRGAAHTDEFPKDAHTGAFMGLR